MNENETVTGLECCINQYDEDICCKCPIDRGKVNGVVMPVRVFEGV